MFKEQFSLRKLLSFRVAYFAYIFLTKDQLVNPLMIYVAGKERLTRHSVWELLLYNLQNERFFINAFKLFYGKKNL